MKVCVIGAGVIGCATAYQLARIGHEVQLLDAAPQAAAGTSFANGAQLSYSYVDPLANPATFWSIPKLLLDIESPFGIQLRPSISQWKWIASFLLNCTPDRSQQGSLALLSTASLSRATLDRWIAEDELDLAVQRTGKLVLSSTQKSLQRQAKQAELQSARGMPQAVLDRIGCIAREPALASYEDFVGGIWTASDCAADPRAYCDALLSTSAADSIQQRWNTRAQRFVIENHRVVALQTSTGDVQAEAFVLATGIEAPALGNQLGETLPIQPIKGYSLTLEMISSRSPPLASVTDLARKTVFAPLGEKLRVAAFAELGSWDLDFPDRRLQQMKSAVEKVYPGLCDLRSPSPWAGLRPATPGSLPIVRQSRVRNVFLNVGHGALGFTLAAGCAVQLAEAMHDARMPLIKVISIPSPQTPH